MIDFLRNPKVRLRFALGLFVTSLVGWPLTALTIFKDEPQGILGLSWFAITLTAMDIVATTDVRKEQDQQ